MKLFTFLALISLLLSGCASTAMISSHQESNVDVDVSIDYTTPILVIAKDGSDTLTVKRYLPDIVKTLQNRGFTDVSISKTDNRLQLIIDLDTETLVRTKKVPIFNHNRNTPYVVCRQNASTGKRTCITRFRHHMEPIVSGYNMIETETTLYRLRYQLKDSQNTVVLNATHSLTNNTCSKWAMFALLVQEAMSKADFSQPVDRSYNIDRPLEENCQSL